MKVTIWKCFLLVPAVALFCRAQQSSIPEFEVVSVKASLAAPGVGFLQQMGGDPAIENYTNVDLRKLILRAYGIKDYRLTGPDWMGETLFDIRAKIPEGISRDQVPAMMRKLLADRFHLVLHRESKELPVYDLVVTKGGIKTSPPGGQFVPKYNRDGSFTVLAGLNSAGTINLTGTPTTIALLVDLLSASGERPVIDKTGLTGEYQFKMRWQESDGPLSDALETYLGLKLESRKAPIELLVIDHVDKLPSAN
jgi:uncharacterized protein (TIGR03435 family)